MSGDTTYQALERLTYMPDRASTKNGHAIAGQYYYDVFFTGGDLSGVTITNSTIVTPIFTTPVSLANGGTGSALSSPGDDRILFWDQSANKTDFLIPGSGLVIVDKTMTVSGVGDVTGPGSATDNAITRFNGTTGKVVQNSGASIDDSGNITATNLSGTNTGDQTITLTGAVTGSGTGSFATTFRNSTGLSVLGRSANSSGAPADIVASVDGSVLVRSGTSIGFSTVNLASGNAVSGTLSTTSGGTGNTSYTTGDILYSSATNTLSKLAIGTSGQILTIAAGVPSWATNTTPVAATQAQQETATSTAVYVSPGAQQYHPCASKAWVNFNGTGTVAIRAGYNVSSITDNGTGNYTVNFTIPMASANYCVQATCSVSTTGTEVGWPARVTDLATGGFRITTSTAGSSLQTLTDNALMMAVVWGDI